MAVIFVPTGIATVQLVAVVNLFSNNHWNWKYQDAFSAFLSIRATVEK